MNSSLHRFRASHDYPLFTSILLQFKFLPSTTYAFPLFSMITRKQQYKNGKKESTEKGSHPHLVYVLLDIIMCYNKEC